MNELTIKNFETLELNELEAIDGGSAWSDLGKLIGAITTGATGGAGLGGAICGPGCAIVGGLYGAVAGGAAHGWDVNH